MPLFDQSYRDYRVLRNRFLETGNNPVEDDPLLTLAKFSQLTLLKRAGSFRVLTVLFSQAVGLSVDDVSVIRFRSLCLLNFLKRTSLPALGLSFLKMLQSLKSRIIVYTRALLEDRKCNNCSREYVIIGARPSLLICNLEEMYGFLGISWKTEKSRGGTCPGIARHVELRLDVLQIACVQTSPISFIARGKGTSA